MSDNVTLNSPTVAGGKVVSSEDVGGVQLPRSKIMLGAAGVDGGDVTSANPFPVVLPPPTTAPTGQARIAVTNVAVQITSTPTTMRNGAIVKAFSGNAGIVYVGASGVTSSTGYELGPGEGMPAGLIDLSTMYVVGAGVSDGVCFVAS